MTRPAERADARRNRSRLLSAAREVFAERGIGADVREICERSGVGVATLYRNFATKDDLIAAISAEAMEEVEGRVEAAANEGDPRVAVSRLIEGVFETVERYHELARALQWLPGEANQPEKSEQMVALTADILDRAQLAGVVRADITPALLVDVLGAVALLYLQLLEQWPAPAARETVARMAWAGLGAAPAPAVAQPPGGAASETRE